MSWSLRYTDRALDDLADVQNYIAVDNPAAAEKLISDLLKRFDRTADFPMIGHAADEIGLGYRVLTHGRHLLIYRVFEDERSVELVRVVHGARDRPTLFDS